MSQETRGNLFAHSCLEYFRFRGIECVVMDDDAAGPLFDYDAPQSYIASCFDAKSVEDRLRAVRPSHVWMLCAGKEVQVLFLRALEKEHKLDLLPGGAGAYAAATDWVRLRETAQACAVGVPYGDVATSIEGAGAIASRVGFPVFMSASQPRGGGGARIAYNHEELASHAGQLLGWSLSGRVLVVRVREKHPQFEVHLLRDDAGRCEILGCADTIAPLGVHIGNSAAVFPAMSIEKKTQAAACSAAEALADKCGVVGYAVLHFGVEPNGSPYTVGMRMGVTSTSHTVAVGLSLDLGRAATIAAFGRGVGEATKSMRRQKRVAVSVPHFDNELFPGAGDSLGPHKTSTGMGTGVAGAFAPAFMTACRSADEDAAPLVERAIEIAARRNVLPRLAAPRVTFIRDIVAAIAGGHPFAEIAETSGVGRTHVESLAALVRVHQGLKRKNKSGGFGTPAAIRAAREAGFSRAEIALATGRKLSGPAARTKRTARSGKGAFVVVGPPAPTVGCTDESDVVLRGYCAAYARAGYKVVLAGWRSRQPLDVLTKADRVLWGEPFDALEQVLSDTKVAAVYVDARNTDCERLASRAAAAGAALVGADQALAEVLSDRKGLAAALSRSGLLVKEGEEAGNPAQARRIVASLGYPVLVRERGSAHEFVVAYDAEQLDEFLGKASGPVIVERFLEDLLETAVVVIGDGKDARSLAVIEVLEEPGISSIDRAGVLPPFSITPKHRELLADRAQALVSALGGRGLVTLRLGMRYEVPYFLSATVGASREVPFAAMALTCDIVEASAKIFMGESLSRALPLQAGETDLVYIRQPVFSFGRFPGADTVLGTRPRSTGDVLGVGTNFSLAYAAARRATGRSLPKSGTVFLSLRDRDKRMGMLIGRQLVDLGFKVVATEGTARALSGAGVEARTVHRVSEGRPNVVDLLKNREITMVIYTPTGHAPKEDEVEIRTVAWSLGIPVITAAGEALAALGAIEAMKRR